MVGNEETDFPVRLEHGELVVVSYEKEELFERLRS